MAQVVYQGFYDDIVAGFVKAATDVRARLVMSNTTIDTQEDAQTISDFTTLDECDGTGYVLLQIANLTVAYDSTNDRLVIDGDDGDFDGGSGVITASSRTITRVLIERYVDGTDANDVPWFSIEHRPVHHCWRRIRHHVELHRDWLYR
jgi:hypothetical protein